MRNFSKNSQVVLTLLILLPFAKARDAVSTAEIMDDYYRPGPLLGFKSRKVES